MYRRPYRKKIKMLYQDTFIGYTSLSGKLWTAPEILRENFPPARGTQKGDVYSFAIVCYEIMQRSEPYNFELNTPRGK